MKEIRAVKTRTPGNVAIDLWFKTPDQLFDTSDPFPFPEKELTDEAEEAIYNHVLDLNLFKEICLNLHLPRGSAPEGSEDQMANAVRRHFSFRLDDLALDKVGSWREGKVSVLLMLMNAAVAVVILYYYFLIQNPSFLVNIFAGIIIILNWVTIWDTYEYFLYDWRQLWRKSRVYEKISRMKVVVRQTS